MQVRVEVKLAKNVYDKTTEKNGQTKYRLWVARDFMQCHCQLNGKQQGRYK